MQNGIAFYLHCIVIEFALNLPELLMFQMYKRCVRVFDSPRLAHLLTHPLAGMQINEFADRVN